MGLWAQRSPGEHHKNWIPREDAPVGIPELDRKTSKENQRKKEPPRANAIAREEAVKQKEHRVDALAPGADEGRDKLRKAAGRSTYPVIRRYPNGETRMEGLHAPYGEQIVIRRGPAELKHLSRRRKRKKHRFRE